MNPAVPPESVFAPLTDVLHSLATFFVVEIEPMTFFACICAIVYHVRVDANPIRSPAYLKSFLFRLLAVGNAPMVPALIACAAFRDLIPLLSGTTMNFLIAAAATGYATYYGLAEG